MSFLSKFVLSVAKPVHHCTHKILIVPRTVIPKVAKKLFVALKAGETLGAMLVDDVETVLVCVGTGGAVLLLMSLTRKWYKKRKLLQLAERKRLEETTSREQLRERLTQLLQIEGTKDKWNEILQMKFTQLQGALQNDRFSCIDVLVAYQYKALQVHDKTNCVTEFFLDANEWAQQMDSKFGNKPGKPPLFGIPLSVKDNYFVKGYKSTVGYCSSLSEEKATSESYIVQVLRENGCVPFVHTNLPQSMWAIHCTNPVFGETTNPYDPSRTCGGSSGGEGALIGSGGSILGLGGDIGGSVRIPAHFSGHCSMKPTANRITRKGGKAIQGGMMAIQGVSAPQLWLTFCYLKNEIVQDGSLFYSEDSGIYSQHSEFIGPMAQDVAALVEMLKVLYGGFIEDHYLPPVKFQMEVFQDQRKLTIGYYTQNGFCEVFTAVCMRFTPHPLAGRERSDSLSCDNLDARDWLTQTEAKPFMKGFASVCRHTDGENLSTGPTVPACVRAVEEAKKLLEAQGHRLVEWQPPHVHEIYFLLLNACLVDDGQAFSKIIYSDIPEPFNEATVGYFGWPVVLRHALAPFLSVMWPRFAEGFRVMPRTSGDVLRYHQRITECKNEFMKSWTDANLDATISPPSATVAPSSDICARIMSSISHTGIYNLMDYPSGVVPMTHVTEQDQILTEKHYPQLGYKNEETALIREACISGTVGFPVGVQVTSLPWQDEKCLRILQQLEHLAEFKSLQ